MNINQESNISEMSVEHLRNIANLIDKQQNITLENNTDLISNFLPYKSLKTPNQQILNPNILKQNSNQQNANTLEQNANTLEQKTNTLEQNTNTLEQNTNQIDDKLILKQTNNNILPILNKGEIMMYNIMGINIPKNTIILFSIFIIIGIILYYFTYNKKKKIKENDINETNTSTD